MNRVYSLCIFFYWVFLSLAHNTANAQAPIISDFFPNSGGGGQAVVIYGYNFFNVTGVSFGGVPARSFSNIEPFSVLAYVDTIGASGNVVVTTGHGTGTKPGFTFTPLPIIHSFSPATGGTGTTVAIHGSNFNNANAVLFGTVPVPASSFSVISPNLINAVVGPGSSGNLTIITPNGSGNRIGFTHTGPSINSLSPLGGSTGTTLTINGTNFTGTTSVTVGGIPVTSYSVVSSTIITAQPAAGSSGLVTVTTANGSSSKRGYNIATITSFTPTEGNAGSIITIKGYNFSGTDNVSFGNETAVPFVLSGDTIIAATITAGSSSGLVKVSTVSYGKDSTYYFSFYGPYPRVRSASDWIGGQGSTINLKGIYFNATTAVRFGNTPASSYTVLSDSVISAVVGSGSSGSIEVVGTSGGSGLGSFYFTTLPLITSFTPEYGPVGSVVSIKGANFSTNPTLNTVYFGAVKANVLTASANTITAIVPPGASHSFLSVSTGGLTASATRPFVVTFPGDTAFTSNSFASPVNLSLTSPRGVRAADFDGDGKPDLAVTNVINQSSGSVAVFRNTGTQAVISFDSPVIITANGQPGNIYSVDVDGDGKLDVVAATRESIAVFKNTSTTGNISFSLPYYTGIAGQSPGIYNIAIADFDRDGKPDLAATNYNDARMFIMRNTSSAGTISFSNSSDQTALIYERQDLRAVTIGDLNGDKLPDVLMMYRWDTTAGTVTLELMLSGPQGPGVITLLSRFINIDTDVSDVIINDIDGDLKPEICLTSATLNKVYVLKYRFGQGLGINLEPLFEYTGGGALSKETLADLNGDGKPDLVTSNGSVFGNSSSPGSISFASPVNFTAGYRVCLNDLDADGKPEIILTDSINNVVSILRNKVGLNLIQVCPNNPGSSIQSDVSGSSYQWQVNTGSGFTDIIDNTIYSGSGTSALQLGSIPSSWYGYEYRCLVDGTDFSRITEIRIRNIWTGVVSSDWENPANWSCGIIPDANTDVLITTGNVVVTANTTIRNLSLSPDVNFTINPGVVLTITHP